MKVPFLNLRPQHEPLHRDLLRAIERVLESQTFVLGPEVEKLEAEIAAYCGTAFAVGVSSGTDALLGALMALGVGPGDEVLTSPYSFFATAGAIVRVGARPVFADIDPRTYNLDPSGVEAALTSRTRVILPVHLFGQCADMGPILELARKYHLWVLEDAAQALGAHYRDGRRAGSMGEAGCFSFYPSKNLGALGEGGMVVTQREDLARRLKALRVHGSELPYEHRWVGGNFRLDALQAAVLRVKLGYLDRWIGERRRLARRYQDLFWSKGLVEKVGIGLPQAAYALAGVACGHTYHQFVIRAPCRDELRAYLQQRGIGTEIYYPIPLHLQACLRFLGYRRGDFPEAERAAREGLALPLYPGLGEDAQEAVVDAIGAFYLGS